MVNAQSVDQLRARALSFPTAAPEADATLRWAHTDVVTVEVAAGGLTGFGWSYTTPAAAEVVRSVLAPEVLGEDPSSPPRLWDRMQRACRDLGTRGIAMAAIGAVDVALWDLRAQQLDVPLVDVWGARRDAVPVYGSGGFVSMTYGELDDQVSEWLLAGCRGVKLKIGEDWGSNVARDMERVARVTALVGGDARVMVDAGGGYSRSQALAVGRDLDVLGVDWFEEPVSSEDLYGLEQVRGSLGCDVVAGRHVAELTDARFVCRAVDGLQLDLSRCGGFTGWRRCAAYAHAEHVPVSAHGAPALHLPLALSDDKVRHLEWFADHVQVESLMLCGAPNVDRGRLGPVPGQRAGHGYRLADVEEYAVEPAAESPGPPMTVVPPHRPGE